MGMPSNSARYWTPEDVWALPEDGKRYECIAGELLVTPSPSYDHQYVLMGFLERLVPYVRRGGLGVAMVSPADVRLRADSVVQPDLFVAAPRTPGERIRDWADIGALLLAVEVVSPTTATYDRGLKRRFYQTAAVDEYWVVDPGARLVERWRPNDSAPAILRDALTWLPAGTAAQGPLVIDLPALFAAALDT